MLKNYLDDILLIIGALLISIGAGLYALPAGIIAAGVFCIAFGVLFGLPESKEADGDNVSQ